MAKHVIRQKQFGYNDECYYVSGANIYKVYDDKEEAEAAFKKLELAHIRNSPLDEQASLWDADEDFLKSLNDFVEEKTGEKFFKGDRIEYGESLPSNMTDDDVIAFGDKARISGFQIISFENEPKFYAIWLSEDKDEEEDACWHKDYDECSTSLVYSESREKLLEEVGELASYKWDGLKLKGTLEELSNSPELLSTFIEKTPNIKFSDKAKPFIKSKTDNGAAFAALNDFLKIPLFEIKELTVEEVQEIELDCGEEEY